MLASLHEDNVSSAPIEPSFAEQQPRLDVLAKLSPAAHLVEAVFGNLSSPQVDQLRAFTLHRVAEETRKQYAGYVISFVKWAHDMDVPPHLRFPTSPPILLLFFSTIAPFYSKSTLTKYVSALKFWHIVHGLPWPLDQVQGRTVLQAFANLSLSKLDKRRPVRIADLRAMRKHVDLQDGAECAVFAAALAALWSMARHGEFTVRSKTSPHPLRPRRRDVLATRNRDGHVTSLLIHLPSEKVGGREGFDRPLPALKSDKPLCPVVAYNWHKWKNPAPDDAGVFAYQGKDGKTHELTSSFFLHTVNAWLAKENLSPIDGHFFRIGGATFLYSTGKTIAEIQHLGGWKSDAALLYIREVHARHAEICATIDLSTLDVPVVDPA